MFQPLHQHSPPGRLKVYALWLAGAAGLAGFVAATVFAFGDTSSGSGSQVLFAGLCLIPVAACAFRAVLIRAQAAGAQREEDGVEREAAGVVREAAGVEREAAGAQREEDGAEREAAGVVREAAGVEREAAGAQREEDGAEREAGLEESILRNAGEGISRLDNDGVVTFANPAASRMTGYASGDLEGRFLHGRRANRRADGSAYLQAAYPNSEAAVHNKLQDSDIYWRKDGTSFPVEFTSTPIVVDGEVQGEVIVFKDITDRREAERAKNEFTSVVSHELRTPLTSIRGSLGLLDSGVLGELPEKGRRMVKIAVENTDRLVRLINDILDMERINSGAMDMRFAPCDASEMVDRVIEEMQPVALDAEVRLQANSEPAGLCVDPDRLLQVLTNLISNAVKFSEPGGVVRVSSELSEGSVLFRVSDTGRGIPPDMCESIFERFQQVDASDSREKGGTGLGLSICHTIVERHRGRIWVESEVGVGSTFSFVLPVEVPEDQNPVRVPDAAPAAEPASAGDARATEASGNGTKAGSNGANGNGTSATQAPDPLDAPSPDRPADEPLVLIVEDDSDLADVLATTLMGHGISNVTATTGASAIALSQKVRPDLLVLDVVLPEADGFEVVEWLRRHETLSEMSVFVYTAQDLDAESRERLQLGGNTEFFTKARTTPEAFEARVTRLLGLTNERTNGRAPEVFDGS